MKLKGKISIIINRESTTIEVVDSTSNCTICRVEIDPQNFQAALARLSHVDCDIDFNENVNDKVGKTMIHKSFEFKLLSNTTIATRESDATKVIDVACPEGWIPDYYFGSKDSFFKHNGEWWARCVIRKWE